MFRNKHGVKITQAERNLLNSLKSSIRRVSKEIDEALKPFQQETYLRYKTGTSFVPKIRKTSVHTFESREDFLKEVEHLMKLKTDLSTNKPRKPKDFDDLPKRLKRRQEREEARHGRNKRLKASNTLRRRRGKRGPRTKAEKALEKISTLAWVNKRNTTYRENMIRAVKDVFPHAEAKIIEEALNDLSEIEFLRLLYNSPEEIVSYVYHDPNEIEVKLASILEKIEEAKLSTFIYSGETKFKYVDTDSGVGLKPMNFKISK